MVFARIPQTYAQPKPSGFFPCCEVIRAENANTFD